MATDTGPGAITTRSRRGWLLALPWAVAAATVTAALGLPRDVALPTAPDEATVMSMLEPAVRIDVLTAARVALGAHGLDADGPADAWVLDQVVGAVTDRPDGSAEVEVHATVIDRGDAGWSAPRAVTAVVPLTGRDRPRVAGPAVPAAAEP